MIVQSAVNCIGKLVKGEQSRFNKIDGSGVLDHHFFVFLKESGAAVDVTIASLVIEGVDIVIICILLWLSFYFLAEV